MTAALRPVDRALLVGLVRALLDANQDQPPLLVVSTQLVEAGVDLSFDRVYRDFAPLPSLVQAAGRCNRAFDSEEELGRVVLWRLGGETDRLPAEQIYQRSEDRLTPTSVALDAIASDDEPISEATMVSEGVKRYYESLHAADHREHEYDGLVGKYRNAAGEWLREQSMVEDHTTDVLVVTSDADLDVLEAYLHRRTSATTGRDSQALGTLQQLFASVPDDHATAIDETETLVSTMGFDCDLSEFAVVDDRDGDRYDVAGGVGLRPLDE